MKFKGWIKVKLTYDLDVENEVDAEIQMRSAANRIKNQELSGTPEVLLWGVMPDEAGQEQS